MGKITTPTSKARRPVAPKRAANKRVKSKAPASKRAPIEGASGGGTAKKKKASATSTNKGAKERVPWPPLPDGWPVSSEISYPSPRYAKLEDVAPLKDENGTIGLDSDIGSRQDPKSSVPEQALSEASTHLRPGNLLQISCNGSDVFLKKRAVRSASVAFSSVSASSENGNKTVANKGGPTRFLIVFPGKMSLKDPRPPASNNGAKNCDESDSNEKTREETRKDEKKEGGKEDNSDADSATGTATAKKRKNPFAPAHPPQLLGRLFSLSGRGDEQRIELRIPFPDDSPGKDSVKGGEKDSPLKKKQLEMRGRAIPISGKYMALTFKGTGGSRYSSSVSNPETKKMGTGSIICKDIFRSVMVLGVGNSVNSDGRVVSLGEVAALALTTTSEAQKKSGVDGVDRSDGAKDENQVEKMKHYGGSERTLDGGGKAEVGKVTRKDGASRLSLVSSEDTESESDAASEKEQAQISEDPNSDAPNESSDLEGSDVEFVPTAVKRKRKTKDDIVHDKTEEADSPPQGRKRSSRRSPANAASVSYVDESSDVDMSKEDDEEESGGDEEEEETKPKARPNSKKSPAAASATKETATKAKRTPTAKKSRKETPSKKMSDPPPEGRKCSSRRSPANTASMNYVAESSDVETLNDGDKEEDNGDDDGEEEFKPKAKPKQKKSSAAPSATKKSATKEKRASVRKSARKGNVSKKTFGMEIESSGEDDTSNASSSKGSDHEEEEEKYERRGKPRINEPGAAEATTTKKDTGSTANDTKERISKKIIEMEIDTSDEDEKSNGFNKGCDDEDKDYGNGEEKHKVKRMSKAKKSAAKATTTTAKAIKKASSGKENVSKMMPGPPPEGRKRNSRRSPTNAASVNYIDESSDVDMLNNDDDEEEGSDEDEEEQFKPKVKPNLKKSPATASATNKTAAKAKKVSCTKGPKKKKTSKKMPCMETKSSEDEKSNARSSKGSDHGKEKEKYKRNGKPRIKKPQAAEAMVKKKTATVKTDMGSTAENATKGSASKKISEMEIDISDKDENSDGIDKGRNDEEGEDGDGGEKHTGKQMSKAKKSAAKGTITTVPTAKKSAGTERNTKNDSDDEDQKVEEVSPLLARRSPRRKNAANTVNSISVNESSVVDMVYSDGDEEDEQDDESSKDGNGEDEDREEFKLKAKPKLKAPAVKAAPNKKAAAVKVKNRRNSRSDRSSSPSKKPVHLDIDIYKKGNVRDSKVSRHDEEEEQEEPELKGKLKSIKPPTKAEKAKTATVGAGRGFTAKSAGDEGVSGKNTDVDIEISDEDEKKNASNINGSDNEDKSKGYHKANKPFTKTATVSEKTAASGNKSSSGNNIEAKDNGLSSNECSIEEDGGNKLKELRVPKPPAKTTMPKKTATSKTTKGYAGKSTSKESAARKESTSGNVNNASDGIIDIDSDDGSDNNHNKKAANSVKKFDNISSHPEKSRISLGSPTMKLSPKSSISRGRRKKNTPPRKSITKNKNNDLNMSDDTFSFL